MEGPVRIHRKEAVGMDVLVHQYIKSMKLAAGLNTQRIFAAWDACSGAGSFTLRRFFRGGKLYITLNSSVVKEQIKPRLALLKERINDRLARDEFFSRDDCNVSWVEEIVLK